MVTQAPDPVDYSHLPATPPPSQWRTTQDATPPNPGPLPLAYDDDADLVMRYLAGA